MKSPEYPKEPIWLSNYFTTYKLRNNSELVNLSQLNSFVKVWMIFVSWCAEEYNILFYTRIYIELTW